MLFVDLAGSTAAVSELDPEEAMEHLRPSLDTMRRVAEEYEGTVIRLTGDGLLALFGAPRALEGHAMLACRSAIAIHAELARLSGLPLARIGLHSGELVATQIKHAPLGDGAYGATIHLASRMEQLAPSGSTYLTAATHELVRGHLDFQFAGSHQIQGFAAPIDVYELRGFALRDASTSAESASFVGRSSEMLSLERLVDRARAGNARAACIVASPGVGKSRLCHELSVRCAARGFRVQTMRALAYGHATPYQPVLELARSLLHLVPGSSGEQSMRRVSRWMRVFGIDVDTDLDAAYDFLGMGDSSARVQHDPAVVRARLFGIVRRLISKPLTPALIVIEDLHWLDAASETFVRELVQVASGSHTFILLNTRPEYDVAWLRGMRGTVLQMKELGERPTRAIASELIGADPRLAGVRERIAARSGGNPLFLDALVHALHERGIPGGTASALKGAGVSLRADLPSSIQSVLGARIDGLDDQDRNVLQVASVIGVNFDLDLLPALTELSQEDLKATMANLCAAGLIEQVSHREHVFAFRHPLIQEVAYNVQLKSRRNTLHATVAQALEGFYKGQADEFSGLLSHHYEMAGQSLEAAQYLVRAALWVGKTDSAQALLYWKHACELVESAPRSISNDALRILVNGQVVNYGWRAGLSLADARRYSSEAEKYASELGDAMLQSLLIAGYARFVGATGSADVFVALILKALALIADLNQVGRKAMLNAQLAQAYRYAGRLHDALWANTRALRRASAISKPDIQMIGFMPAPWIMAMRGLILFELGRIDRARHWLDKVIAMGDLESVVQFIAHHAYVRLALFTGDDKLASEHSARIALIVDRTGLPYIEVHYLRCAGLLKLRTGDPEGAISDFTKALRAARRAGVARETEAHLLADVAEAHGLAGRVEAAMDTAKRALTVASRRKGRLAQCQSLIVLASLMVKRSDPTMQQLACAYFDRAAVLVRETGSAEYEAKLSQARR